LWPDDRPAVVPSGLEVAAISPVVGDVIRRAGARPFFMGLAAPVATVSSNGDADRTGVEPNRTVQRLDHPSRRYLVHLNAPGWNVIGATAPWLPGIAVGHNNHIAWDTAAIGADTQDVFVEKLNPSNPHQVWENGRWVATRIVTEPIVIRGNPKPFMFDAEFTRHGAIVASDGERHLAFALRWSGTEPGAAPQLAVLALNRASSWPELTAAVARWKVPALRVTYAGADGRRGSLAGGVIPVRRGWNGALPAPAWPGAYEWTGWQSPASTSAGARTAAASAIAQLARDPADRVAALLQNLSRAGAGADSLRLQRALIVDAIAESMRAHAPADAVVFEHPLAISAAARRRFNIGPIKPVAGAGGPFAIASDPVDWDRSAAMNAPGQSGSPDSAHFSDFARKWAAGERVELAFTDAAVQAAAESTLTLTVRTP
jgi:acyl-homoserine lactone acylase PvdQ